MKFLAVAAVLALATPYATAESDASDFVDESMSEVIAYGSATGEGSSSYPGGHGSGNVDTFSSFSSGFLSSDSHHGGGGSGQGNLGDCVSYYPALVACQNEDSISTVCDCVSDVQNGMTKDCVEVFDDYYALTDFIDVCESCSSEIETADETEDCTDKTVYCKDGYECYSQHVDFYLATEEVRSCLYYEGLSIDFIDYYVPSAEDQYLYYCDVCPTDTECYYCDDYDAAFAQPAYNTFKSSCSNYLDTEKYDPADSFTAATSQIEKDIGKDAFASFCAADNQVCENALLDAFAAAALVEWCYNDALKDDYLPAEDYYFPEPAEPETETETQTETETETTSAPTSSPTESASTSSVAPTSSVSSVVSTSAPGVTPTEVTPTRVTVPASTPSMFSPASTAVSATPTALPACTDGTNSSAPNNGVAYQFCAGLSTPLGSITCISETLCAMQGKSCWALLSPYWTNGACDAHFNCELYNFDGGECSTRRNLLGKEQNPETAIASYQENSADAYNRNYTHPTSFDWAVITMAMAHECSTDLSLSQDNFLTAYDAAMEDYYSLMLSECPSLVMGEDCSGNGECVSGVCECELGYYSYDCSTTVAEDVLKADFTIAMSTSAFTSSVQYNFREGIAKILDTTVEKIVISGFESVSGRRLLADSLKVSTVAYVSNPSAAKSTLDSTSMADLSKATGVEVTGVESEVYTAEDQMNEGEGSSLDDSPAFVATPSVFSHVVFAIAAVVLASLI